MDEQQDPPLTKKVRELQGKLTPSQKQRKVLETLERLEKLGLGPSPAPVFPDQLPGGWREFDEIQRRRREREREAWNRRHRSRFAPPAKKPPIVRQV